MSTTITINGHAYQIRVEEGLVFIRRDGDFYSTGEIRHTDDGVRFEGRPLASGLAEAIDSALSALSPRPEERPAEAVAREVATQKWLLAKASAGAARVNIPEVARRIGRELAWLDGPFRLQEAQTRLAYRRLPAEPGPLLLEVGLGWCDGRHVTSADFEGEPGIDLTTLTGPSSALPTGAGDDEGDDEGDDGTVASDALRALDGRAVFGPGGVG